MVISIWPKTFKISECLTIYFLTFSWSFAKLYFLESAGRAEPFKLTRDACNTVYDDALHHAMQYRIVGTDTLRDRTMHPKILVVCADDVQRWDVHVTIEPSCGRSGGEVTIFNAVR